MKKNIFLLIALLYSIVLVSQNRFVYMGELLSSSKSFNSIRFDGDGEIYPEISIDINTKGCYIAQGKDKDPTTVEDFYSKECILRNRILEYYKINLATDIAFDSIQKIIVKAKIDSINAELKKEEIDNVTFIMVGFNNHYINEANIKDCAPYKLDLLQNKINSILTKNGKRTLIINVLWDGTETVENGLLTALNFAYSSANSYWAGLGLREIVNGLSCEKVQFISHSMGANIITECIFNQYSKLKQRTSFAKLLNKYQEDIPIPYKKMSAGLIAPAIPGVSTFVDLTKSKNKASCKFVIGYNTKDSTLGKKFKPLNNVETDFFVTHFSSTTLGFMKSEVDATEALLKGDNLKLSLIDFSKNPDGSPQGIHDLEVYMKLPQYDEMLKVLYDIK